MDTKIVVEPFNGRDDLVILHCGQDDDSLAEFLSEDECTFWKNACGKGVPQVLLPKGERFVVVQSIKTADEGAYAREEARKVGADLVATLSKYQTKRIAVIDKSKTGRLYEFLEGMSLGNYQFTKYLSDKQKKCNWLEEICIQPGALEQDQVKELEAVITSTFMARDLVNEPQSYLSAIQLSKEIQKISEKCGFQVEVLDKRQITALKMGGLLAVNRGSIEPPRFNILEWKPPSPKNKKPIVLVGKGIVYDTGGLSLKPTANSMDMMKADMAGAATVVGALASAALAGLPIHLIGLVPSTDNRPGNDAYAPGDVIRMYSGATVEVLNTDAEGRLVLADALHFAKKYSPELVMDFATLTGAATKACGHEAICFMGTASPSLKQKIKDCGDKVFERLIEFPLWEEYGKQLQSNIADLKNLGGPYAGMITAGKFLEHFISYPWLHFDIAGPAYLNKKESYRPKEGTGVGVRLLFEFFNNY